MDLDETEPLPRRRATSGGMPEHVRPVGDESRVFHGAEQAELCVGQWFE